VKLNKGLQVSAVLTAGLLLATACSSSKKAASTATSSAAAPSTPAAATSAAAAPSTPAAATSAAAPVSSAAAPASGAPLSTGLIGLDFPRSDTAFWASYISYVPKEAKILGANLTTTSSNNNIQTLIANVPILLAKGAKAIDISPQDTAAIGPTIATLDSMNIPVISVDTATDTGNTYMVVRADNVAYGNKACQFLGTELKGTGSVVVLEGDTASINGRDRTNSFESCMKTNFPNITVHGEPSKWDGPTAASQLQTALTADKNIRGVYMESSFALDGTIQDLKQAGLTALAPDPKHVYVVSNDGVPEELADIAAGTIDATVSQPADQYAYWGIYYAQAAIAGKTFAVGPTTHGSNIVQVRAGVLEDQLAAPLVTKVPGSFGNGVTSIASTDTSLWGNHASS
jgi:ABC-type sugar transport system substrate-binding protein